MDEPQKIRSISIDAQLLAKRLASAAVGEIITYQDMNALTGRNVQFKHRGILDTARNKVLRDNGIVFGTINTIGIKRLSDPEIIDQKAPKARERARRIVNKSIQETVTVNFEGLSDDDKLRHQVSLAIGEAIRGVTSLKKIRDVQNKLAAQQERSIKICMERLLEEVNKTE